jgi:hypothetical protein
VDENPVYVKADYWTMKSTIPKHVKQATQNHAKGGYHAPLSNAAGEHFLFFGACISVFPEGINDPWPALSRGSPSTSNPISSSPRGRNGKLIIEEQCENSPQKRAKDNPPNATKIMSKCTVKNPSKKGPKTTFDGQETL